MTNPWIPEVNDRVLLPDNDCLKGTICGTPAIINNQPKWPVKLDEPFWNEGEKKSFYITVILVDPCGMVLNGHRIPKGS
jgi:hypothetical protein